MAFLFTASLKTPALDSEGTVDVHEGDTAAMLCERAGKTLQLRDGMLVRLRVGSDWVDDDLVHGLEADDELHAEVFDNTRDAQDYTALHRAARDGDTELLEELVSQV